MSTMTLKNLHQTTSSPEDATVNTTRAPSIGYSYYFGESAELTIANTTAATTAAAEEEADIAAAELSPPPAEPLVASCTPSKTVIASGLVLNLIMVLLVVFELGMTFFMVFGGILPYYPQYLTIMKKKDETGFSTYVCLTLLIANMLRIIFWFGRRFENVLLLQSVAMIMAMLAMLHLCISIRNQNDAYVYGTAKAPKRVITDFDFTAFWDWTEYSSYISFLMTFYAVVGTMMYFGMTNVYFVEFVGGVALLSEALLAIPQLLKNYKTGSTDGLSIWLVVGWSVGDVFKTAYFIIRKAPKQFYLCGLLQVFIDILIFIQFIYYKGTQPISVNSDN